MSAVSPSPASGVGTTAGSTGTPAAGPVGATPPAAAAGATGAKEATSKTGATGTIALPAYTELLGDVSPLMVLIYILLFVVWLVLFHWGAAKLSYDTFGSVGWGALDFFFPYLYFPYYALFVSTPKSTSIIPGFAGGGRRRR